MGTRQRSRGISLLCIADHRKVIQMSETILNNGLPVSYTPLPATHSFAIDLFARAGAIYEDSGKEGITHFLEHLHFRRLYDMTQPELYYYMESIGTTLRAVTYRDCLRFYLKIAPRHFEKALAIFKNILLADDWSDDDVSAERKVVLNEIYSKYEYDISELAGKNIFSKTPYERAVLGSEESVSSITREDVLHYKRRVFNSGNLKLFISGPVSSAERRLVANALGDIQLPSGERQQPQCRYERFGNRAPDIVKVGHEGDFIEADISFDVPEHFAAEVPDLLNCILGEGVGSRLQRSVREQKCYTNEICSWLECYEDVSVLHIRFVVYRARFEDTFASIIDVLKDMRSGISREDLETSLPFFEDNRAFYLDSPEDTNFLHAFNSFVLSRDDRCSYSKIGEETLRKASAELFTPRNMCVTLSGACRRITKKRITQMCHALDSD